MNFIMIIHHFHYEMPPGYLITTVAFPLTAHWLSQRVPLRARTWSHVMFFLVPLGPSSLWKGNLPILGMVPEAEKQLTE